MKSYGVNARIGWLPHSFTDKAREVSYLRYEVIKGVADAVAGTRL